MNYVIYGENELKVSYTALLVYFSTIQWIEPMLGDAASGAGDN